MEIQRTKESTPKAVFIIDDSGAITSCNKVVGDMFGLALNEIKGKIFSDIALPEKLRKQFMDYLHNLEEAEKKGLLVKGVEHNVLHHDGYEFPVELNICPVEKLYACSFIITVRDIRERKQRAQILRQSTQNQQIINSILKISLEDYSLDEILLHALESVLLLKRPKLLNKGAILLVDEDSDLLILKAHKGFDDNQVQACTSIPFGICHCGRAALTGEIQFSECVDAQHDIKLGNMVPHGHYCVPICFGHNILGVLSLYLQEGHTQNIDEKEILLTITNILAGVIERKKIEIQRYLLIKRQEAMITRISDEKKLTESIIKSLNAGLMVFDLDGKLVNLNACGRLILSQFVDADASESDKLARFADIFAVNFMWKNSIPPSAETDEVSLLNVKDEEISLEYSLVPWENTTSRQVGIICLFSDITERLQIQQEMEKMNRLSTVAEIASAVAHEVRNPLAGIKTMSQAIEENCDTNDENKEYITRIIKQVDRLNDLLTEFFTYAKPGKARKENIPIAMIVNEIQLLLKAKLNSRRITLEEDYADGLPDIYVDPDQMQQVLLNLMLNAIDAINTNGKIEIRARLADKKITKSYRDMFPDLKNNIQYVEVHFKDNGKGMSPEVAAKAFEPFYTTKNNGSGLGLAIVNRILNENNAFIMADPSQQQGVAFIMMFESVN